MTTPEAPYGNPTDLDLQEERGFEARRREMAAEIEARKDAIAQVSTPRGRRGARQLFAKAKLYHFKDEVVGIFDRHHGSMCIADERRTAALELLWPLLRALALEELPLPDFQKLMLETDR